MVAGCLTLATAGCGTSVIDQNEAQKQIETRVESALDLDVRSTQCPSNEVVKPHDKFKCHVTASSGESFTVVVRIVNSQADIRIVGITPRA